MRWKESLMAALTIGAVYAFGMGLGITCPIRFVTGISCPGCGMTRAWLSLLRLDLTGAVSYHPLFWLPVPAAVLWLFRHRLPSWMTHAAVVVICGAAAAVYLLRLRSGSDPVVVWAPEEGLLHRLWCGA